VASVTKAHQFKNGKMEVIMTPPDMDKYIKALDDSKTFMLTAAHKQAAEAMKNSIIGGFNRAQNRVRKNTEATILYKGGGKRPLYDTGALKKAMDNVDVKVTHNSRVVTGVIEIDMPGAGARGKHGMGRKNKKFPYPLAHLFGAGGGMTKFGEGIPFSLPRRDFLSEGVKDGSKRAATIMTKAYKEYYIKFIKPTGVQGRLMPFMWEKEVTFGTKDLYSMALPPMSQYSALGFGSDFGSAFMMSFNAFTVNSWFGTLAAGHAGMTKQTYIRRGRKTAHGR